MAKLYLKVSIRLSSKIIVDVYFELNRSALRVSYFDNPLTVSPISLIFWSLEILL